MSSPTTPPASGFTQPPPSLSICSGTRYVSVGPPVSPASPSVSSPSSRHRTPTGSRPPLSPHSEGRSRVVSSVSSPSSRAGPALTSSRISSLTMGEHGSGASLLIDSAAASPSSSSSPHLEAPHFQRLKRLRRPPRITTTHRPPRVHSSLSSPHNVTPRFRRRRSSSTDSDPELETISEHIGEKRVKVLGSGERDALEPDGPHAASSSSSSSLSLRIDPAMCGPDGVLSAASIRLNRHLKRRAPSSSLGSPLGLGGSSSSTDRMSHVLHHHSNGDNVGAIGDIDGRDNHSLAAAPFHRTLLVQRMRAAHPVEQIQCREVGGDNLNRARVCSNNASSLLKAWVFERLGRAFRENPHIDASLNQNVSLPPRRSCLDIKQCPWSSDLFAASHGNHTVVVYRVLGPARGCSVAAVLSGHRRTPWTVAFHPWRQNLLVSGGLDETIRVWDWQSRVCLHTVSLPNAVSCVDFYPSRCPASLQCEVTQGASSLNGEFIVVSNTRNGLLLYALCGPAYDSLQKSRHRQSSFQCDEESKTRTSNSEEDRSRGQAEHYGLENEDNKPILVQKLSFSGSVRSARFDPSGRVLVVVVVDHLYPDVMSLLMLPVLCVGDADLERAELLASPSKKETAADGAQMTVFSEVEAADSPLLISNDAIYISPTACPSVAFSPDGLSFAHIQFRMRKSVPPPVTPGASGSSWSTRNDDWNSTPLTPPLSASDDSSPTFSSTATPVPLVPPSLATTPMPPVSSLLTPSPVSPSVASSSGDAGSHLFERELQQQRRSAASVPSTPVFEPMDVETPDATVTPVLPPARAPRAGQRRPIPPPPRVSYRSVMMGKADVRVVSLQPCSIGALVSKAIVQEPRDINSLSFSPDGSFLVMGYSISSHRRTNATLRRISGVTNAFVSPMIDDIYPIQSLMEPSPGDRTPSSGVSRPTRSGRNPASHITPPLSNWAAVPSSRDGVLSMGTTNVGSGMLLQVVFRTVDMHVLSNMYASAIDVSVNAVAVSPLPFVGILHGTQSGAIRSFGLRDTVLLSGAEYLEDGPSQSNDSLFSPSANTSVDLSSESAGAEEQIAGRGALLRRWSDGSAYTTQFPRAHSRLVHPPVPPSISTPPTTNSSLRRRSLSLQAIVERHFQ